MSVCVTSVTKARPTADNCGWCQEGHPTVKTMPNIYDDDVTSLGYSWGVPCKRRAEASPDLCEKWTRATGLWAVPVKEASSSESMNVECEFNDWKRKGVGGSDGEDEGGSALCAGDPVEAEQGEIVRWRLQVVLQWCR